MFSSRRASITADLRARAAQFEQRYGRKPSQRELAQLAQAVQLQDARREGRSPGSRGAAQGLGGQARAHARREPGVGRAVGVARRRQRSRAHARPGRSRPGPRPARDQPGGAESGRAGPAGKEHLDPRGPDQVPGPGPAPVRHGPGRGRRPARRSRRPGAAVGVRAGGLPGRRRSQPGCRAACCAPTGAASTSGTGECGTPRTRSCPWRSGCSRWRAPTARRA